MAGNISDLVLLSARLAFTLLNDFTPKRSIDELTRLVGDLSKRAVDTGAADTRTRLEARRTTVLQAQRVAVQTHGSAASVRLLQEESALLEKLSRPVKIERDVWAGSLDKGGMLDPIWQPAEAHAGTAASMLRNVGAMVAPTFADRRTRDEEIQLRTRLQERAEILREMRPMLSAEAKATIDVKLAAIERVRMAIDPPVPVRPRPTRPRFG